MTSKIIYLPGLNGLRAIAALSVVFSHITLELDNFNLNPFLFGVSDDGTALGLDLATYGVSIFFTLSGFLITYLLLKEKQVQEIDIKKFYLRRILRIWPLYYLFLIIAVLTTVAIGEELNITSLFLYIFYLANVPFIFDTSIPLLAHYWSLGVEEQFYLFWPWIIKKIRAKLSLIIAALIVILIGTKIILHFFFPASVLEEILHVSRFHCMLIGGLGAILFLQPHSLFLKVIDNKLTQIISLSVIVLLLINRFHIASVIDNEIVCVVTVCLIIGQINIKNRIFNFDTGIFDFLGKISYGIYVIHPLVIFFLHKNLFPHLNLSETSKYITIYVLAIGFTIFISYLSYHFFEKYFLILKEKVTVIKSSGTKFYK